MKAWYRPEVDGLRAIAVVAVVLFHADVEAVSGGFIGVDVFFVVSGYLITQIIQREIDQAKFRIATFYERRARRILPALCLVCAATFIASWFLLLPSDFRDFSQSLFSVSIFSSNFLFWIEAGYFAAASHSKPLLHTWSLAIEEQFYMLFPLLLMAMSKVSNRVRVTVLGTVFLFSLGYSEYAAMNNPSSAFYLLPARAWELALGALLAFARPISNKPDQPTTALELTSLIGLLGILIPVLTYDSSTRFPGLSAIIPCFGTALIIVSTRGQETTHVGHALRSPVLVKIGLISYSLYLWHWILLVLSRYYVNRPLTLSETTIVIFASLILSYFSWRFIESPFRTKHIASNQRAAFAGSFAALSVLGVFGVFGHWTNGFQFRANESVLALESAIGKINPRRGECHESMTLDRIKKDDLCRVGRSDVKASFLIWGDSHASALMPSFEILAEKYEQAGFYASQSGCPPLLGIERIESTARYDCESVYNGVLEFIDRNQISHVVLIARWAVYVEGRLEEGQETHQDDPNLIYEGRSPRTALEKRDLYGQAFRRTIERLTNYDVSIWVVRSVPEQFVSPRSEAINRWFDREESQGVDFRNFRKRQLFVNSMFDSTSIDINVLDPATLLCDPLAVCRIWRDSKYLYWDDDHLNTDGAAFVAPAFEKLFVELEGGVQSTR